MSDLSKYLQTEYRDYSPVRRGRAPVPTSPDMGRVLTGLDSFHLRGLGPHLPLSTPPLEPREPGISADASVEASGGGFFTALRRAVWGGSRAAIKS